MELDVILFSRHLDKTTGETVKSERTDKLLWHKVDLLQDFEFWTFKDQKNKVRKISLKDLDGNQDLAICSNQIYQILEFGLPKWEENGK